MEDWEMPWCSLGDWKSRLCWEGDMSRRKTMPWRALNANGPHIWCAFTTYVTHHWVEKILAWGVEQSQGLEMHISRLMAPLISATAPCTPGGCASVGGEPPWAQSALGSNTEKTSHLTLTSDEIWPTHPTLWSADTSLKKTHFAYPDLAVPIETAARA